MSYTFEELLNNIFPLNEIEINVEKNTFEKFNDLNEEDKEKKILNIGNIVIDDILKDKKKILKRKLNEIEYPDIYLNNEELIKRWNEEFKNLDEEKEDDEIDIDINNLDDFFNMNFSFVKLKEFNEKIREIYNCKNEKYNVAYKFIVFSLLNKKFKKYIEYTDRIINNIDFKKLKEPTKYNKRVIQILVNRGMIGTDVELEYTGPTKKMKYRIISKGEINKTNRKKKARYV
jgi:hypothetical protein